MTLKQHRLLLVQAIVAWLAFFVVGLPRYYQQYSDAAVGFASVLLSVMLSLWALWLLIKAKPASRRALANWCAFYFTVPFALLDALYCVGYLHLGWAYLWDYWYLTVFYLSLWLTLPPTAWLLNRAQH